jgi:hypothetical protein
MQTFGSRAGSGSASLVGILLPARRKPPAAGRDSATARVAATILWKIEEAFERGWKGEEWKRIDEIIKSEGARWLVSAGDAPVV